MFRLTIKLALVAILAHAGIRIVPVFWTNLKFKDALVETARYGAKKSAEDLTARAHQLAAEMAVPLNGDPIKVVKGAAFTTIDTRYVAQLEYFPRQYYPWEFKIHVEEAPSRYDAYIP